MASPQRTTSMLLASLIFFLYWMSSSARSYDPTALSTDLRVKREMPDQTREKVKQGLEIATASLNILKDVITSDQVVTVMQGLASFASLAPGIGTAIAAVINMALLFIPQEDPTMKAITEGFSEVNRKLDSISIQITNLAIDVEWQCSTSTYSKSEVGILNAWKKMTEINMRSASAKTKEEKQKIMDEFTKFYEDNKAEASMMNLHHYLTVTGTSMCKNLNELLKKKFKCNIHDIGRYNIFFNNLLLKGVILNQAYGKMKGHNLSGKKAEYAKMFKSVYEQQIATMNFCLDKHEQYMKTDVEEIAKANSPKDKTSITDKVKKALDTKYSWYEWVVLVYDTKKEKDFVLFQLTKIPVDTITVAVGYTLKSAEPRDKNLGKLISDCCEKQECEEPSISLLMSTHKMFKVTHATKSKDSALQPQPFTQKTCIWPKTVGKDKGQLYIFFSKRLEVCTDNPCKNGGKCTRFLQTNDWSCTCPDDYYGETCEKQVPVVEETGDLVP